MPRTVLEQIQDLDRQKAALMSRAKSEAVKKVEHALSELNSLGFNYRLVEKSAPSSQVLATKKRQLKDAPCPICKFKTEPRHDGRTHRSQGASKKPFTATELQKLGFERV